MTTPDYATFYGQFQADPLTAERTIAHNRHYANLLPPILRDSPILDVGCGWGYLLSALALEGFTQSEGIDISAGQVQQAIARGVPATMVPDSRAYLLDRPSHYGAVFMLDVLEHLPIEEHGPMLAAVAQSLQPGGLLILKVPNALSVVGGAMRYIDPTHTSAFTPPSLRFFITSAGLSLRSIEDEIPYGSRPPLRELTSRGNWARLGYWALQKLFRTVRRLEIMADMGGDFARAAPLAPNLMAIAFKPPHQGDR